MYFYLKDHTFKSKKKCKLKKSLIQQTTTNKKISYNKIVKLKYDYIFYYIIQY